MGLDAIRKTVRRWRSGPPREEEIPGLLGSDALRLLCRLTDPLLTFERAMARRMLEPNVSREAAAQRIVPRGLLRHYREVVAELPGGLVLEQLSFLDKQAATVLLERGFAERRDLPRFVGPDPDLPTELLTATNAGRDHLRENLERYRTARPTVRIPDLDAPAPKRRWPGPTPAELKRLRAFITRRLSERAIAAGKGDPTVGAVYATMDDAVARIRERRDVYAGWDQLVRLARRWRDHPGFPADIAVLAVDRSAETRKTD